MKRFPVACVLLEPAMQNVGVILPKAGYLKSLINLCEANGSVCIFDEVKTGFRTQLGGYQAKENLKPHLSVFGKAVANGYPLGIIGGKREIMQQFDHADPTKRVLIAGMYNAHPVNTIAAIATLEILKKPAVYEHITKVSNQLYDGLKTLFREKGIVVSLVNNASAFCVYFAENAPTDLHDILETVDFATDVKYRKALIDKGVYHIPIACKQGSVSYSHTAEDIAKTLEITQEVLKAPNRTGTVRRCGPRPDGGLTRTPNNETKQPPKKLPHRGLGGFVSLQPHVGVAVYVHQTHSKPSGGVCHGIYSDALSNSFYVAFCVKRHQK